MTDKCCARVDVQATHWEGCHTSHPDCAAYKAGFKAGMRRAAEIAMLPDTDGLTVQDAILAEADK